MKPTEFEQDRKTLVKEENEIIKINKELNELNRQAESQIEKIEKNINTYINDLFDIHVKYLEIKEANKSNQIALNVKVDNIIELLKIINKKNEKKEIDEINQEIEGLVVIITKIQQKNPPKQAQGGGGKYKKTRKAHIHLKTRINKNSKKRSNKKSRQVNLLSLKKLVTSRYVNKSQKTKSKKLNKLSSSHAKVKIPNKLKQTLSKLGHTASWNYAKRGGARKLKKRY